MGMSTRVGVSVRIRKRSYRPFGFSVDNIEKYKVFRTILTPLPVTYSFVVSGGAGGRGTFN